MVRVYVVLALFISHVYSSVFTAAWTCDSEKYWLRCDFGQAVLESSSITKFVPKNVIKSQVVQMQLLRSLKLHY